DGLPISVAVAKGGGMGPGRALLMQPDAITDWVRQVRAASNGAFQLNLWIPDPAPVRDPEHEAALRTFLGQWGPEVSPEAGDATPPDFDAQCEAVLAAGPAVISSIMGVYPPDFVRRVKDRGVSWWANVTTVAE